MSLQTGRHSRLRRAYPPARRDPQRPRDSARRLCSFHRTSSWLCRISLTQDFTPGRRVDLATSSSSLWSCRWWYSSTASRMGRMV